MLFCLKWQDFTPLKPKIYLGRTPRPPSHCDITYTFYHAKTIISNVFLCGGTKSPAGGHTYENYCLESCFNCKNRFRPSLSRIDFFLLESPPPYCLESCFNCKNRFRPSLSRIDFFFLESPSPPPPLFFVCLFFFFFCLSKFFGMLDPPDENSWIRAWNRLMDFRESWKRWSTHGPLKVCCFPVISAQGWIRVWVKIGLREATSLTLN